MINYPKGKEFFQKMMCASLLSSLIDRKGLSTFSRRKMPSFPVVSLHLPWTIMNRHYETFSTRSHGISGREASPKKFRKSRKTLSGKRSSPKPTHLFSAAGHALPHP